MLRWFYFNLLACLAILNADGQGLNQPLRLMVEGNTSIIQNSHVFAETGIGLNWYQHTIVARVGYGFIVNEDDLYRIVNSSSFTEEGSYQHVMYHLGYTQVVHRFPATLLEKKGEIALGVFASYLPDYEKLCTPYRGPQLGGGTCELYNTSFTRIYLPVRFSWNFANWLNAYGEFAVGLLSDNGYGYFIEPQLRIGINIRNTIIKHPADKQKE